MPNLNTVTLAGHLADAPEMRYTPKGTAVAKFSVAVNETYEKDGKKMESTTFVDCTAWTGMAEKAAQMSKGNAVYVVGKLRKDSWEDKQTGKKVYKLYVNVDALTSAFTGEKKAKDESDAPAAEAPLPF